MAVTKWYYQDPDTDQRAGPVSVEFIRELLLSNTIADDTLIWSKGMLDWVSASSS